MPEIPVQSLYDELDEAILIMTIAKSQNKLMYIKGVVRYIKSMCPSDIKAALKEFESD